MSARAMLRTLEQHDLQAIRYDAERSLENDQLVWCHVIELGPSEWITDETGEPDPRYRVATLAWRVDTGEIQHIWVERGMRRQGLATALWDIARHEGARHSPSRTLDGQAWAAAVAERDGDTLPVWRLA